MVKNNNTTSSSSSNAYYYPSSDLPIDSDQAEEAIRYKYSKNFYGKPASLYGGRLPRPSYDWIAKKSKVFRSAQITTLDTAFGNTELAQLKDPYHFRDKARFEDSYRTDGVVRRAINLRASYTWGSNRTKTVIDIAEEFATDDKQKQALEGELSGKEVDTIKNTIDRINRRVRFHERIKAAMIQTDVGGRSALLIETGKFDGSAIDGPEPSYLKVLNWRKLQDVYADIDSWEFLGVGYADRDLHEEGPLKAEEIIYLTSNDYHISPDTLYFGLSAIEPVADVSEANRLLDQEDIKEATRSMWAASGLIKFPPNASDAEIEKFLQEFYPGTYHGTSQDVDVEVHELKPDIAAMAALRNENDRRILRSLGVPSFLMNFEDVTNRATTDRVMQAWKASDLDDRRTWLQDQLEPQWFDSIILQIFPDLKLEQVKWKAKLEFQDITFESLKDKAAAVVPLYQAGIVPLPKVLEILDMKDVLEQVLAQQAAEQRMMRQEMQLRQQELEMQQRQQQQQQVTAQNPGQNQDPRQRPDGQDGNAPPSTSGRDGQGNGAMKKKKQPQPQRQAKHTQDSESGIKTQNQTDEEPQNEQLPIRQETQPKPQLPIEHKQPQPHVSDISTVSAISTLQAKLRQQEQELRIKLLHDRIEAQQVYENRRLRFMKALEQKIEELS